MSFELFAAELFKSLGKDNKDSIIILETNNKLVKEYLTEKGNKKIVDKFVQDINDVILTKKNNNFSIIEQILLHPLLSYVFTVFKDSDVMINACKYELVDTVKWLLRMDINPFVQDKEGKIALMYAVKNKKFLFLIKQYIKNKDLLEIEDMDGNTVIFYAIGNVTILKEIVNSGIDINHKNKSGETPLIYCCKNQMFSSVDCILKNENVDKDITDNEGKTAAMHIVLNGRPKLLFQGFVKFSYELNKKTEDGQCILSVLLKKLYSPDDNCNSVDVSKKYKFYIPTLIELINMGINFNVVVDEDGNTGLMAIIIAGDFDTLRYVLNNVKSVDFSIKNKYGESATSLLIKKFHGLYYFTQISDCSTLDCTYVDPINNNTILMLSAINLPTLVSTFIERNPKCINQVNNKNENALILAIKANQNLAVTTLLKNNINVNQQDIYGNTALHYAVEYGNPIYIYRLMEHNANIEIKNNEGKTPLNIAYDMGNKKIIDVLMEKVPLKKIKKPEHEIRNTSIQEYLYTCTSSEFSNFKMTDTVRKEIKKIYRKHEEAKFDHEANEYMLLGTLVSILI